MFLRAATFRCSLNGVNSSIMSLMRWMVMPVRSSLRNSWSEVRRQMSCWFKASTNRLACSGVSLTPACSISVVYSVQKVVKFMLLPCLNLASLIPKRLSNALIPHWSQISAFQAANVGGNELVESNACTHDRVTLSARSSLEMNRRSLSALLQRSCVVSSMSSSNTYGSWPPLRSKNLVD